MATFAFTALSAEVLAQSEAMGDTIRLRDDRPAVAVLPFANYTGEQEALAIVPMIELALWHSEFYVVRSSRVRGTLRHYRIRTAGMIKSGDAQLVAERWDTEYLLLGSLDIYKEGVVPEAAFSIRILEASTMRIVWANSVAATGADFTGLFGLGRITNMPALLRTLVREAVEDAHRFVKDYESQDDFSAMERKLAVVIFDNQSSNRRGGEIVSSMLLSRLWNKNLPVIEAGDVIDAFRSRNLQARGEVMMDLLVALKKEWNVAFVITGSVDEFRPGRASSSSSFPSVLISGRLVSTQTGLIASARDYHRRGGDSELVLGMGAKRSLGDLSYDLLDDMIHDLLSDAHKKFATRR